MIFKSRRLPPCPICGHNHAIALCDEGVAEPSRVPLETPSANGVYRGTLTPRIVAPGVMSDKEFMAGGWSDKGGIGRAHQKGRAPKMKCKHGHPLSGDNLYVAPDGTRRCRQCQRDRQH